MPDPLAHAAQSRPGALATANKTLSSPSSSAVSPRTPRKPPSLPTKSSPPIHHCPSIPMPDGDPTSFSSDSDTEQKPVFVLHRRLQLRNPPALNSPLSGAVSGVDIFTSNIYNLDKDALKESANLKDTDIVQLHYPVALESTSESEALSLSDIAPTITPQPSTSKQAAPPLHQPLTNRLGVPSTSTAAPPLPLKTTLPKMPLSGANGPPVASLYYSPYSSFAPQYDSTGSLQTCEQTRTSYLSRQRLDHWVNRKTRYAQILPENIFLPSSELCDGILPRRRKRQKIERDFNMDDEDESGESEEPRLTKDYTRTCIDRKLARNSLLIRNLQERQYERLRRIQDTHLDPALSTTPIPSAPAPPLSNIGTTQRTGSQQIIGLGAEELEDADRLMSSLSELLELRPQASSTDNGLSNMHSNRYRYRTIVPSRDTLRATQESLLRTGSVDASTPVYLGTLPTGYAVGLKESSLTSQSNTQLLDNLTKPPVSSVDSSGGLNGRTGGIIGSHNFNARQQQSGSPFFSFRDPALLQQHTPTLQSNFRSPGLVDHLKMNSPITNGSAPSPIIQAHGYQGQPLNFQSHHHLLQSTRIMSASPFRSRPGISSSPSPSPLIGNKLMPPSILSPTLNDHPNHRALASKLPLVHPGFGTPGAPTTTINRIT